MKKSNTIQQDVSRDPQLLRQSIDVLNRTADTYGEPATIIREHLEKVLGEVGAETLAHSESDLIIQEADDYPESDISSDLSYVHDAAYKLIHRHIMINWESHMHSNSPYTDIYYDVEFAMGWIESHEQFTPADGEWYTMQQDLFGFLLWCKTIGVDETPPQPQGYLH